LTTGLGVILLGFDGNRYTASASEGYFTNVIRIGVKLLLFYAVLAIVAQWEASLAATRKPVAKTVPLIASYYAPPAGMPLYAPAPLVSAIFPLLRYTHHTQLSPLLSRV